MDGFKFNLAQEGGRGIGVGIDQSAFGGDGERW
jgi:hypothetical protein